MPACQLNMAFDEPVAIRHDPSVGDSRIEVWRTASRLEVAADAAGGHVEHDAGRAVLRRRTSGRSVGPSRRSAARGKDGTQLAALGVVSTTSTATVISAGLDRVSPFPVDRLGGSTSAADERVGDAMAPACASAASIASSTCMAMSPTFTSSSSLPAAFTPSSIMM